MVGPAHLNLHSPDTRFRMISGGTQNQRMKVSASMIAPSIRSGISPAVNRRSRRHSQTACTAPPAAPAEQLGHILSRQRQQRGDGRRCEGRRHRQAHGAAFPEDDHKGAFCRSLVGLAVGAAGEQDRRQHRHSQRQRQQPWRAVRPAAAWRHIAGQDRADAVASKVL